MPLNSLPADLCLQHSYVELRKCAELSKKEDAIAGRNILHDFGEMIISQALDFREKIGVYHAVVGILSFYIIITCPFFLIFLFQWKFLAFQSEFVTNWHRFWISADAIAMTATMLNFLKSSQKYTKRNCEATDVKSKSLFRSSCVFFAFFLLPIFVSFCITFPGEFVDGVIPVSREIKVKFPRTLSVVSSDVSDWKTANGEWSLDLAGRSFREADLSYAKLQKVNLKNADLTNAKMELTELQGADLTEAQLLGANMTSLVGVGAKFHKAKMQGVNLMDAKIDGADMSGSTLHGANFYLSFAQGVDFSEADAAGANFRDATLQGAKMSGAQFRGAAISDGSRVWRASHDDQTSFDLIEGQETINYTPSFEEIQTLPGKINDVPPGPFRAAMEKRIGALMKTRPAKDDSHEMERLRQAFGVRTSESFQKLTNYLNDLMCHESVGAIHGIVERITLPSSSAPSFDTLLLARRGLDPDCAGEILLKVDERAKLQKFISVNRLAPFPGSARLPQAAPQSGGPAPAPPDVPRPSTLPTPSGG